MSLLERIEGINRWIEENPNVKDPNMYEIMDCTVELGKLARKANVGDMPGKYPEEGELQDTYKAYRNMVNHRISHEVLSNPDSLVNYKSELYGLFCEINMRCQMGEYIDPEGMAGQNKKELLCRLSGVGLFIEQQKHAINNGQNIEKIYDNESEFERIKSLYQDYMSQEHPQSSNQITSLFESIEKEYNFSKENERS